MIILDVDTSESVTKELKRIATKLIECLELSKVEIHAKGGLIILVMFNWQDQSCFKVITECEVTDLVIDIADLIIEQVP